MSRLPPPPDMAQLDDDPREGVGAVVWGIVGVPIWAGFCLYLVARALA